MTRTQLASHLAAALSLTRTDANRAVETVFTVIGDTLASGEPVTIAGFGTFTTRHRPARQARQARNPRTGDTIDVAASRTAAFKPGKTLREVVNRTHG